MGQTVQTSMHSVIKIVTFLIFGAAVAFGDARALLAGGVLVFLLYVTGGGGHIGPALKLLRRLRWFFLSIAVVYLLFTPGRLLLSAWSWGPTLEGVTEGGQRIVSLVLIVLAVNLLLRTTSQPQLISAILWCLTPLGWCGIPRERIAVRMALTLDAVAGVQSLYRHEPRDAGDAPVETGPAAGLGNRLWRIGAAAQRLVLAVVERAESLPVVPIEVPRPARPPFWQWSYPALLGGLFIVLHGRVSW